MIDFNHSPVVTFFAYLAASVQTSHPDKHGSHVRPVVPVPALKNPAPQSLSQSVPSLRCLLLPHVVHEAEDVHRTQSAPHGLHSRPVTPDPLVKKPAGQEDAQDVWSLISALLLPHVAQLTPSEHNSQSVKHFVHSLPALKKPAGHESRQACLSAASSSGGVHVEQLVVPLHESHPVMHGSQVRPVTPVPFS